MLEALESPRNGVEHVLSRLVNPQCKITAPCQTSCGGVFVLAEVAVHKIYMNPPLKQHTRIMQSACDSEWSVCIPQPGISLHLAWELLYCPYFNMGVDYVSDNELESRGPQRYRLQVFHSPSFKELIASIIQVGRDGVVISAMPL
jgi:hypothetical protein